jgi:hypothetical protein
MFSRLALAAALAIGLSTPISAQYNYNNNLRRTQPSRQQPPAMVAAPVDIQGTIEGATRGGIMLLDSTGQRYQVVIPPAAKIHVTGSATADCLQSGQLVEFKAEIDDHGTIKEKVEALALVTLSPEKQMGMFPAADAAGDQGGLMAGPEGSGKAAKPKRASGKAGATPAGAYRIVGRLLVGRGGKLSVQAGHGALTFELTEQPAITVDLSDYTLARKDDKATVKAIKMQTRSGTGLAATEVTIELAEPLAGTKKKGASAKSEGKRPAKPLKKDEGLPEPAADK